MKEVNSGGIRGDMETTAKKPIGGDRKPVPAPPKDGGGSIGREPGPSC